MRLSSIWALLVIFAVATLLSDGQRIIVRKSSSLNKLHRDRILKGRAQIIRCCGISKCMPGRQTRTTTNVTLTSKLKQINKKPTTAALQKAQTTSNQEIAQTTIPNTSEAQTLEPEISTGPPEPESAYSHSVATSTLIETTSSIIKTSTAISTSTSLILNSTPSSTTPTSTTSTTTTSTTTQPKLFTTPSCESFYKGISIPPISKMPSGSFKMRGSAFVFISSGTASVTDAASGCNSLNMNMLAINNTQEYLPLLKKLPLGASYWTSGSNEGLLCAEKRMFTWCSTATVFDAAFVNDSKVWTAVPTGIDTKANCVTLGLYGKESKLALADCSEQKPYMCQPKCEAGTCPMKCNKNNALFYKDALLSPNDFGLWADVCGGKFLFGNKIVNWEQNIETCCSLGMSPIIFPSVAKQNCLNNYTSTNWTGNLNYWTGGTQGCRGAWGWCSGQNFIPITEKLTWARNQPDMLGENENCLHMRILGSALSDRNCSDKYIYACEAVDIKFATTKDTICPEICKKDPTLFTNNGTVKAPFSLGDWYTTCGNHLFIPNTLATWSEAWNYCCSFGMKLFSVETTTRHACLSKFAKRYDPVLHVEHWTSATDEGSAGDFLWCTNRTTLNMKEVNWKSGQPSDGHCAFVQFSNKSANQTYFSTGDCTQKKKFICSKNLAMSEGDLMQQECMSLYDLTIELIWEWAYTSLYSTSNLSTKMKCFIKCIGEQKGLLLFGKLNLPLESLRIIEDYSATPEELQKNMEVVGECGNPTSADECTRAAEIYDCGKKKAPVVTKAIQSDLKIRSSAAPANASVVFPTLATDLRLCRTKALPCVIDLVLKNLLTSTGATSLGAMITASNGRRFFKSNLVLANAMKYGAMYDYCCSLGMKQPEFETNQDLQTLDALNFGFADYIFVGETFVDGQNRNVWCNSKKVVTDINMYYDDKHNTDPFFSKEPSCFKLVKASQFKLVITANGCSFAKSNETNNSFFLCE